MTKNQTDRQNAIERLREWLKPGDTVHTIIRHVSASGMTREIGIVLIGKDGETRHPNFAVADALGLKIGKRDGVRIGGCGMDMGFEIVYSIGRALWPNGFKCAGEKCQSNDHSNDRNCKREKGKHQHQDGGYALRQVWL